MAYSNPRYLATCLLSITLLLLAACGGGSNSQETFDQEIVSQFTPGQRLQLEPIDSHYTGVSYPLKLFLPHNHAPNRKFPVIYILDAEWRFETVADSVDKNQLEVILVGIENYVDDDYKHREMYSQWPLAKDYFDFLTIELLPSIEKDYSIDETNRTVMGHSLTGLFVGIALLIDSPQQPYFHRHVSFDGSFWAHRDVTPQLVNDRLSLDQTLSSRVILVAATAYPNNARYVSWFEQLLAAAGFSQLELDRYEYDKAHIPVVAYSMNDVINALY
ncbi:alpha/beta hydrolase [Pseudoalteromonas luteoviolacea]|uniref:Esterase n=1 Tax=Pseudoalteromonas luteoviolacea H33 TaxID=1365251 RepID=A0A167DDU6_9GAMM|nr:alpha/beta hydrolase-fold protein [Pseudoalteromonas luteoviolacea]KZN48712.1 hypothetical protein N476_21090 [Pseudoalteromonas luteoviolacea H33]KZN75453.1 hypothetical protein N477_01695 [Pseudoalteromonas luteoviolacea H33-S]